MENLKDGEEDNESVKGRGEREVTKEVRIRERKRRRMR